MARRAFNFPCYSCVVAAVGAYSKVEGPTWIGFTRLRDSAEQMKCYYWRDVKKRVSPRQR